MILKLKIDIFSLLLGLTTLTVATTNQINPFTSPFVYVFVLLGIVITLGKDYKDPKRKERLTLLYISWSVIISIGFSLLVALAWQHSKIGEFTAYCSIVGVSAFAPTIIDRFTDNWTDTIGSEITELIKSFFKFIKQKFFGNGTDSE